MASINKLSIRGVRSFSPDDEEQVISFCFPLTIIVGANGCGKTTIIESLKYAVTGQMPPGVRSGQAFVHDPKSAGQSSVKANIKLRFTNRAGTSMVVVRSMEVTQKKTTLQFKALDGVLRTVNPETGERISMSHKCTELDRQIPTLMGVSRPILEHVVFCHQEESSWPLMEGAVLKKRFDEIFDSTRYAKALEAIRKCRLEHQSTSKELKADLEGLKSHKHAAGQYRQELEATAEQISELDDQVQTYKTQMKEEDEKMEEYKQVIRQVDEIDDRIEDKKSEMDRDNHVVENTRRLLERDMTSDHTLEQLKQMMTTFDTNVEQDRTNLKEKEEAKDALVKEMRALRNRTNALVATKGKLEAEREAHERTLLQRGRMMEQVINKYDIDVTASGGSASIAGGGVSGSLVSALTMTAGTQGSIVRATSDSQGTVGTSGTASGGGGGGMSEEDVARFIEGLKIRERDMMKELDQTKKRHEEEIDAVQSAINDLESKLLSIENERKRIEKEYQKATSELQTLSQPSAASRHARVRKSDVDEARRAATEAAKQRDDLASNPRLRSIPDEIRVNESTMDAIQRDIEDDQESLRELRKSAEQHSAIEMLQSQVEQDVARVNEVLNDNNYALQKYNLGTKPQMTVNDMSVLDVLADTVRDKVETIRMEIAESDATEQFKQRKVTEKSTLLAHNQRSLHQLRVRSSGLTQTAQAVESVLQEVRRFETEKHGSTVIPPTEVEPQVFFNHLETMIQEYSAPVDDQPASISRTIKKLNKLSIRKNERNEVIGIICPCCCRDMDPEVAATFKDRMTKLADPIQSEIIQTDRTIARERQSLKQQYEHWRTIVTASTTKDWSDFIRLSKEMEEIDALVQGAKEELLTLENELRTAKEDASRLRTESTELNELLSEMTRLQDDGNRISEKQSLINNKKEMLSVAAPDTNGRSLTQVEADVARRQEEKDLVMKQIQALNREYSKLNHRISVASNHASDAERMARERETRYAEFQESTARKQALTETLAKQSEEQRKLQIKVVPLEQQKMGKDSERNRLRTTMKKEEGRLNTALNQFREDVRSLESLTSTIERYIQSNKAQELERLNHELDDIEAKSKTKQDKASTLDPEIEQMKQQVSEQERHKKMIVDNMELLQSMKHIQELQEELQDFMEEKQAIKGYVEAQTQYDRCRKKQQELLDLKARCEGRRGGLKDQLKALKRKLLTSEYKNVDERHRVKMIEYETTLLAVSDLDKYHSALDKALMRYHSMKISDINKIIRELWTLTYKGEDIYNIELVSGQDGASARASRSYNYRVCMMKGNTQMDMRGRCSAGQRVLASIVIRLALAETFCLNCGVMALDEPTTNLDYENKRGLAIALAQIIAARSAQHNFQLVVITHDEDFVSMMKMELSSQTGFDTPERYFHVRREEGADGKFYSKILAVDWDEL